MISVHQSAIDTVIELSKRHGPCELWYDGKKFHILFEGERPPEIVLRSTLLGVIDCKIKWTRDINIIPYEL